MVVINQWEINNLVLLSALLVVAIAGVTVLVIGSAQNNANLAPVETLVSYGFRAGEELNSWEENDAGWVVGPVSGKSGIVVLHPVSVKETRYVQKKVLLPASGAYKLQVVAANIAGAAEFAGSAGCDDSFVVLSAGAEKDVNRQEFLVNSADGWKTLSLDISRFAGREVTVRVEGMAGGPCGDWAGEWSAVDSIEIIKL
ncbi:MAG: hypothetical protein HYS53_03030 [Candidatus Aenigmarchaeota archaeon]|nr:hypothetical protein [Candidatus Aenigmarchaeota archaeon]